MVANGSVFDKDLNLIEGCDTVLRTFVKQSTHFILCVKVNTDEEESKVKAILKEKVPELPQHHIIFYEVDDSVYNISRQFNPDVVYHTEQKTLDQLKQFIKSELLNGSLKDNFK